MTNDKFQEKMNSIQEKIGQDASNLILDEIGILITDNQDTNKQIEDKDKEIENLKKTNQTLQNVNGNLLQQIAVADENDIPENFNKTEPEKKQPFNFKDVFDEKRKFY